MPLSHAHLLRADQILEDLRFVPADECIEILAYVREQIEADTDRPSRIKARSPRFSKSVKR
jgi:hypothetical protein